MPAVRNSTMINKFGLNRNIPQEIKREVRRRCGFGCVICGAIITEYEHIDPEFKDASVHDPSKITLLCPNHHAEVTKGIIDKSYILERNANPIAKTLGYSSYNHPIFRDLPVLNLGGGISFSNVIVPLHFNGIDIVSFHAPEQGSEVIQVSAILNDESGVNSLTIDNNEWRVNSGVWDFENKGNRYMFRDDTGKSYLCISFNPPVGFNIENMSTVIDGKQVKVDSDGVSFDGLHLSRCSSCNSYYGISFGNPVYNSPIMRSIGMQIG